MKKNTVAFLQAMNARNAAIAARDAQKQASAEPDPIRLEREQERRDKWGQLRAREHPSRRRGTGQVRSVFPFVNPK